MSRTQSLKGYRLDSSDGELGVVAFAYSLRNARKMLASHDIATNSGWRYIDIPVERFLAADAHLGSVDTEQIMEWGQCDRFYYDLGWYGEVGGHNCAICGKFEFDSIPESHLDDVCECVGCSERREEDVADAN